MAPLLPGGNPEMFGASPFAPVRSHPYFLARPTPPQRFTPTGRPLTTARRMASSPRTASCSTTSPRGEARRSLPERSPGLPPGSRGVAEAVPRQPRRQARLGARRGLREAMCLILQQTSWTIMWWRPASRTRCASSSRRVFAKFDLDWEEHVRRPALLPPHRGRASPRRPSKAKAKPDGEPKVGRAARDGMVNYDLSCAKQEKDFVRSGPPGHALGGMGHQLGWGGNRLRLEKPVVRPGRRPRPRRPADQPTERSFETSSSFLASRPA